MINDDNNDVGLGSNHEEKRNLKKKVKDRKWKVAAVRGRRRRDKP